MSVAWLHPAAWWALVAVAVPIVIHLLFRPRSRRLPFPSLRFLRGSRLAALRRRHVSDWPLLVVRVLVLAAAVAATAAPVFVTAARRAAWSERVARAIVVAPGSAETATAVEPPLARLLADERRTAFRSAVFTPAIAADGLRDAVEWLRRQPPAAREVVLAGDFRDGSLIGADVDAVPAAMGLRFLPVAPAFVSRDAVVRAVTQPPAGAPALFELRLGLDDTRTLVNYRAIASGPDLVPVDVRAPAGEQTRAEAALRAVLAEGVLLPREGNRRLSIEFGGVSPAPARPGAPPSEPWMRRVLAHTPDATGNEENGRFVGTDGAWPWRFGGGALRRARPARGVRRGLARPGAPPGAGIHPGRVVSSTGARCAWRSARRRRRPPIPLAGGAGTARARTLGAARPPESQRGGRTGARRGAGCLIGRHWCGC